MKRVLEARAQHPGQSFAMRIKNGVISKITYYPSSESDSQ